jgi:two-component system, cell cycle response regulator
VREASRRRLQRNAASAATRTASTACIIGAARQTSLSAIISAVSEDGRIKTVVTAISKISDRPVAKEACLVVIYGLELGKKFDLNRPQIIVGRSSKAEIQIDQEAVSRNHCKIINTGNAIMLRDMGSTNGTYVNDEMIDEHVLRDGDFVKVGHCIFKFLSGNNIENAYHEEIYRLTTVDGLTQAFNRRYFIETLEREIGRTRRYKRDLSLIMVDIDRFKGVNDSFGHLAGDHVLKQLASLLRTQLRREDVLARYGGEEFAIALPEIDRNAAMQLAEKIRKLVEVAEFKFEDAIIPITVSIGVASLREEVEDALGLIKHGDDALSAAKQSGRNCVVNESNASDFLPNPRILHALGFREQVLRNAKPSTALVCVGLAGVLHEQSLHGRQRMTPRWFQDMVVEAGHNCILGHVDDLVVVACPGPSEATTALRKLRDSIATRSANPAPALVHGLCISLTGLDLSQGITEAISSLPDGAIPRWGFQLPLPLGTLLRSVFLTSAGPRRSALLLQLRDTIVTWLLVWLSCELAELHRIGLVERSSDDYRVRFRDDQMKQFALLKDLSLELTDHSSRLQNSHAWDELFSEYSALSVIAKFINISHESTADHWTEFESSMVTLLRKVSLISPPMFITGASKAVQRANDMNVALHKFSATAELLIGDNAIVPTETISLSRPATAGQLYLFTPNAPPIAMEPFARFEHCDQCQGRELFLIQSCDPEHGDVCKNPTTGHLFSKKRATGLGRASETRTDLVAPITTDVLIITALEEERDAVLSCLEYHMLPKASDDVGVFYSASVRTRNDERLNIVITMLQGMGPLQASTRATYSVMRWLPRYVLMIGIAGGIASSTALGDVIVARQIADYTVGKRRADGTRVIYWSAFPADAALLECALNFNEAWSDAIKSPRPRAGTSRRQIGVVASGGDVIACRELLDQYSADWPRLVGVEMEGGGIATALHQIPSRPGFLMIRGVSDHADREKGKPRIEKWRLYACEAAAVYAIQLLRSGMISRRSTR